MCLYVVIINNYVIRKIDLNSGIITTVVGNNSSSSIGDGGPASLAGFNVPYGVICDSIGNMYISESYKIRKVDFTSGIITTYAGTGTAGNTGDGGLATSGTFGYAFYLCFDPSGNLVVCDTGNNSIRKISSG